MNFDELQNAPFDATASLIYWRSDVSSDTLKKVIEELKRKGLVDSEITRKYQSAWGEPVWYIP
jgi:transcription initiation factor IIE alpha subunit